MNNKKLEKLADFAINLTMNLTLKEYFMFLKMGEKKLEKIKLEMENDLVDILSQPDAEKNYNKNIKNLVGGSKKSKRKRKRKSRTSRRSKKRGGMRRTHSQADRRGFSNPTFPGWSIIEMFMSEETRREYDRLIQRRLQENSPDFYNRDVAEFRSNVQSPIILTLLGIIITYFFVSSMASNSPGDYSESRITHTTEDNSRDGSDIRDGIRFLSRAFVRFQAIQGDEFSQNLELMDWALNRRRD